MGIALGMQRSTAKGTKQFAVEFQKTCDLMAATRPTAVNLFWAIDRMKRVFAEAAQAGQSVEEIANRLEREARRFTTRTSPVAGRWAPSVPRSCRTAARILTHCNAGALATAGYGTALGVIRAAVEKGKRVAVFADETRPFLQGARLTAWELVRDGIDTTVITDNMAGALMRAGRDRRGRRRRRPHRRQWRHGQQDRHLHRRRPRARAQVPFYVAAPLSTDRPGHARRRRDSDRGARPARGHARRQLTPDAGRGAHPQSRRST